MFDLNFTKLAILALIGLVIFGPDQLPRMAAQAGRALRDLRRLADNARADLSQSLGPEFGDFDFNDLNPRAFVRKHLLEDGDEHEGQWDEPGAEVPYGGLAEHEMEFSGATLLPDEVPPYDGEAT